MTRVLGILNVTRDSFSDGGAFLDPLAAIARAEQLARDGAWAVDIGAEATNPRAEHLTAEQEIRRLEGILPALRQRNLRVSVDTYKHDVMRWAVAAGAELINDVTGFRDERCIAAVRDADCRLVVMYSRSPEPHARVVEADPDTIVDEIVAFFRQRVAALMAARIDPKRVILDPGMGLFIGRSAEVSFAVLRQLPRLRGLGFPIMVSTSRKSFIAAALDPAGRPRPPTERAAGTLATELWAADQGVDYIRTHDVRALCDALAVWGRLQRPSDANFDRA